MDRPRKRFQPPGTSPGTLRPHEAIRDSKVSIQLIDYDAGSLQEKEVSTLEECFPFRDRSTVTWINVNGLQDVEVLRRLGSYYGLHPLALEDVLNTGQRPKVEEFDDHCFVVLKDVWIEEGGLQVEQMSLFLGKGWVITLQESPGDPFDPVRERIRGAKGRIRKMGADYLAYALIDALVDGAFPLLEELGERIEKLERELVVNPTRRTLQGIHSARRELLYLRRVAWPQREVVHQLAREDFLLVSKETRIYLRDCYDHTVQILDLVETYRDLAAGMLDLYLSGISNRLNEIMKVLTVMATIFIPLTFITGLYGMNFNTQASRWNMPELNWPWGYPAALGLMACVVAGMLFYFRRKRWI